jgi:hypothetical protein
MMIYTWYDIWYMLWYYIYVIWYMICYDMIHGMIRYDMMLCCEVWHDMIYMIYDMIGYDTIYMIYTWYDICYDMMVCYDMTYDMIWYIIWYDIYDIFVNCSWVDTRWQQYSTHLHTNSTQNNTMKTEYTEQNIRNNKNT